MSLRPEKAELVVGVVARMGVDTKTLVSTIARILKEYDYDPIEIKATDAVTSLSEYKDARSLPAHEKYAVLIDACDSLREKTGAADIMAQLSIAGIIRERTNSPGKGSLVRRTAYIVNQLKRKEETQLLRSLYGEHYVQIAGHAKAPIRQRRLAEVIASDHPRKPKASDWDVEAASLIKRDEAEDDRKWGQRVRDAFPQSDVIVDASDAKLMLSSLDRFFRALFGDPRITPTPAEYGMQLARTASLRSSDLSRQVGACIMNAHQEVQALGCNEVPKAMGGTYWEGDPGDSREFQLGKDSNDDRKFEVLDDLLGRLFEAGAIKEQFEDEASLKSFLTSNGNSISDSQLMDSLEYGRTVHAEMNAITDAARGGHSVRGGTLYCNTFPCHNCAKHIVAAGLARVVYLLPYPKSYAEDLFSDSISVDPERCPDRRVQFEQFVGVLGPMYGRIFEKTRWKSPDGSVPKFEKSSATFIKRSPAPAYADAEALIVSDLASKLEEAGFSLEV
jgi:Deoxycytidylate deaminase